MRRLTNERIQQGCPGEQFAKRFLQTEPKSPIRSPHPGPLTKLLSHALRPPLSANDLALMSKLKDHFEKTPNKVPSELSAYEPILARVSFSSMSKVMPWFPRLPTPREKKSVMPKYRKRKFNGVPA
jgi:hypothetical protein